MNKPVFRRIIDDLCDQIADGTLQAGQRVKSHKQLATEYDVAIATAKKALDILKDRGILVGHKGKGTFVADPENCRNPSGSSDDADDA